MLRRLSLSNLFADDVPEHGVQVREGRGARRQAKRGVGDMDLPGLLARSQEGGQGRISSTDMINFFRSNFPRCNGCNGLINHFYTSTPYPKEKPKNLCQVCYRINNLKIRSLGLTLTPPRSVY